MFLEVPPKSTPDESIHPFPRPFPSLQKTCSRYNYQYHLQPQRKTTTKLRFNANKGLKYGIYITSTKIPREVVSIGQLRR